MINNGKDVTTPQRTQVCVIGSGPAGITTARELSSAGLDVILLDGSRQLNYSDHNYYQQSWPDKVKLYNGLADGLFETNESDFLRTTQTYLSNAESNLMNGAGWHDPSGNINGITGRFTVNADTARSQEIGRSWFWANNQGGSSQMYFEMTPNYDSYVTLNNTVDPVFSQQQTHIHWAFSEQDQKTYETNCELFNTASSQFSSIISWPSWESVTDQWIVNGHHIGTTRMSSSTAPDEGVVNENLKVHGVDNLYVAGSSVFPSTGVSNPTMTIIALSIRLAEHLQTQVSN